MTEPPEIVGPKLSCATRSWGALMMLGCLIVLANSPLGCCALFFVGYEVSVNVEHEATGTAAQGIPIQVSLENDAGDIFDDGDFVSPLATDEQGRWIGWFASDIREHCGITSPPPRFDPPVPDRAIVSIGSGDSTVETTIQITAEMITTADLGSTDSLDLGTVFVPAAGAEP